MRTDRERLLDILEAADRVARGRQRFKTYEDTRTRWASQLIGCLDGDGSYDWSPFVVVVDGVTASLNAAGMGTERTASGYAAFRRPMREVEVPNALAVAHNTLSRSHLMGGVEAQAGVGGLWSYSSDNPDNLTCHGGSACVRDRAGCRFRCAGDSRWAGRLTMRRGGKERQKAAEVERDATRLPERSLACPTPSYSSAPASGAAPLPRRPERSPGHCRG